MVDDVARAICNMAGRSSHDACEHPPSAECVCCEKMPDGRKVCRYWMSFRHEAKAAIQAAYRWHKKERRWPAFAADRDGV